MKSCCSGNLSGTAAFFAINVDLSRIDLIACERKKGYSERI